MKQGDWLAFAISGALFSVFLVNIVMGFAGLGTFFNDVAEMLSLLGASIAFVIAILIRERKQIGSDSKISKQGGESL